MSDPDPTERFARRTPDSLICELTPAQLRVAVKLATYAGPDGRCWPSLRRLGADLGRSPGTVAHFVDELVALGAVDVLEHTDGGRRVLLCTWLPGAEVVHKRASESRGGRASESRGRASESRAGARVSRAEQDHELDHEQEAPGPTDAGRAIVARIHAELEARRSPASSTSLTMSDVGRARARHRYLDAEHQADASSSAGRSEVAMDGDSGQGGSVALRAV